MRLTAEFFNGPPMDVARRMPGMWLCRRMADGTVLRTQIVEVELYHQTERGCHAFGGRRTARNDAMFLSGGHAYVYLCYGLHHMLNIVLGPAGTATAVLVRAVAHPRGRGPGCVTRLYGITRADNKMDLTTSDVMWVEADTPAPDIVAGPRIGIDYAGADAALPWRFGIRGCPYLSRPIE